MLHVLASVFWRSNTAFLFMLLSETLVCSFLIRVDSVEGIIFYFGPLRSAIIF